MDENQSNIINKPHILDEFENEESFSNRYFGVSIYKMFIYIGIIIIIGIYLGIVLFGDNSLEVLLELHEYKQYQEQEVQRLKVENAQLQKKYFELLELLPSKNLDE